MIRNILASLSFAALFACGSVSDDGLFEEAPDGGLVQAAQALASKTSSTYTYGWSQADLTKSMYSPGPNPGILPGRTTIRYKIEGTDYCDVPHVPALVSRVSWRYQAKRGLQTLQSFLVSGNHGNPFTIQEVTTNPSVILRRGSCAGSYTSTTMGAFLCVSVDSSVVNVTESLFGSYKRHDGVLTITFDMNDMWRRAAPGVPFSSCTDTPELHELVEHAGGASALFPHGGGLYPSNVVGMAGSIPAWSNSLVEPTPGGANPYQVGGYTQGELCRIGSWVNTSPSSYSPLTGPGSTCAD